jgi:hypothetical protein
MLNGPRKMLQGKREITGGSCSSAGSLTLACSLAGESDAGAYLSSLQWR